MLAFALIGWFLPGIVGVFAGDDSDAYVQVGEASNEGTVALLAVALLFLLPVNWKQRKFTISWNQAARIDWGTVLLFGGGIVLGDDAERDRPRRADRHLDLGRARRLEHLRHHRRDRRDRDPDLGDDEQHRQRGDRGPDRDLYRRVSGLNPTIPALAAIFAANYGFMLPVSTPPNAIVYSSGLLPITRMIKAGFVFDIIGAVLCIAGVTVMANLVGLA